MVSFIAAPAMARKTDHLNIGTVKNALRYMKKNRLKGPRLASKTITKQIRTSEGQTKTITRKVKRVFVPIIVNDSKNTMSSFVNHVVDAPKGTMALVAPGYDYHDTGYNHYVRAVMSPKLVYTSYYDTGDNRSAHKHVGTEDAKVAYSNGLRSSQTHKTRVPVMTIGRNTNHGLRRFWDKFHTGSSYSTDARNYQANRNDLHANNPKIITGNTGADCMWWLPNAEPIHGSRIKGYKGNLFPMSLKVKSSSPQNIPAVLIHSGISNKVSVVGVVVKDMKEFKKMSESALWGKEPTGGASRYLTK